MKKIFPGIISLCLMIGSCSAPKEQKGPEDFHGVKWGKPAAEYTDLVPVKTMKHDKTFIKKNDDLSFAGIKAESIEYDFYKEQFWCARIKIKNAPGNHEALSAYLDKTYGKFETGRDAGSGSIYKLVGRVEIRLVKPVNADTHFILTFSSMDTASRRAADIAASVVF